MVVRNVLLQQLGVQTWYAHYRLAARSSPKFACAPLEATVHSGRGEKSAIKAVLAAKAILSPVDVSAVPETEAPRRPAPLMPPVKAPDAERAEAGLGATARISLPPVPGFELTCYATPSLLVISAEAPYEQARQQALLYNILKACALVDEPPTWHGQFCWPVFKGDKIGTDQNALLPDLLLRWLHQSGAQDQAGLITFGVPTLLRELLDGICNMGGVNVALPYSLSALLREPAGKAQTWRELKATLPALRDHNLG